MGLLSPLGMTVEGSWSSLVEGRSGIRKIESFETSGFRSKVAATVEDFQPEEHFSAQELRKYGRFIQLGLVAGKQALEDSGLDMNTMDPSRIGVFVGSGIGGLELIEKNSSLLQNGGPRHVSPFFISGTICNMLSGALSIYHGLQGPSFSIVSACATAAHNISQAGMFIVGGLADAMLAGGSESAVTPLGLSGFSAARALSTRWNDEPEKASRPWDLRRDGFVMGEGAGILLLEEYTHAACRGARIYAELAGFGLTSDAYHITQPIKGGDGAYRCMREALQAASLDPKKVGYINAHGTSTPLGDIAETTAIKKAFGDEAPKIPVSSNKSMIGHLLGASGGAEAIFSIKALRESIIPPTVNIEELDPQCDLDYVPNEARYKKIDCAISNSFGFGGTNVTLVFTSI